MILVLLGVMIGFCIAFLLDNLILTILTDRLTALVVKLEEQQKELTQRSEFLAERLSVLEGKHDE